MIMRLSSIHIISTAVLCTLILIYNASSSEQVSVCHGGQVNLTCNTAPNETLLQWSLSIPGRSVPDIRFISSMGSASSVTPLTVGQTLFNFLRTSTSPLISVMVIDNVTAKLNGTRVDCSYGDSMMETTIINVITSGATYPNSGITINAEFENDNITITLEVTVENSVISVEPQALDLLNIGPGRIQLILSYNTLYSVSARATLCGQNTSYFIEVHYVKCISPIHPLSEDNRRSVIADYHRPALEGTNASFTCSHGLVLTGPRAAVCMGNGEWEPEPSQTKCNVDCGVPLSTNDDTITTVYNSTLEGSMLEFSCREGLLPNDVVTAICSPDGMWIPDPNMHTCKSTTLSGNTSSILDQNVIITAVISSIIVFILSSILCFIIGCICGWCGHKHRTKISDKDITSQAVPIPLYEDLQPSTSMPQDREKAFELKENIAYGPIQSTFN